MTRDRLAALCTILSIILFTVGLTLTIEELLKKEPPQ